MTESNLCSIHRFEERDIDLLLAEEFRVNAEFGRWFLERCGCDPSNYVFPAIKTKVSIVSPDTRESDVVILFKTKNGKLHGLYVEDKITAPKARNQLEDYLKRAQDDEETGKTEGWSVVLFAPNSYSDKSCLPRVTFISFEDAAECLSSISSDDRTSYRVEFLRAAAEGNRKGTEIKPYMEAFWKAVSDMLEREFPGYFLPAKPMRTTHYRPKPNTHKWRKHRVHIEFKGMLGEIVLAFKNANYERLKRCIKEEIKNDMGGELEEHEKEVWLRIFGLGPFTVSEDHSLIETHAKEMYRTTQNLMNYYIDNREAFEKAFDDGA